jgi:hypothetical protein
VQLLTAATFKSQFFLTAKETVRLWISERTTYLLLEFDEYLAIFVLSACQ